MGPRLGLPSEARARFPDAFLLPAWLRAQQIPPGLGVPSPCRGPPLLGFVWSSSLQPRRYGATPGPALTHTQGREVLLPVGVSLLPAPEATITPCSALFLGGRGEGLDGTKKAWCAPRPHPRSPLSAGLAPPSLPTTGPGPPAISTSPPDTVYLDLLSVWRLLCPGGQRSWGPGSVSWFTARTPQPRAHCLSRRADAKEHLSRLGNESIYPSSF